MNNQNSIFNLSLKELENFCTVNSAKKFNALQIMKWIYNAKIYDFSNMTNISKPLREYLDLNFTFFGENNFINSFALLIESLKSFIKTYSKVILLCPKNVKFNLIPFNKFDIENIGETVNMNQKQLENNYGRTNETDYNNFQDKLMKAGFVVIIRHSKAQSIHGGCGQLKGYI